MRPSAEMRRHMAASISERRPNLLRGRQEAGILAPIRERREQARRPDATFLCGEAGLAQY
jgi:hypothetical protein